MLLKDVFKSYMTVSGDERSAAYTDKLMFEAMDKFFGPKAVNDITPLDLTNYLAQKRSERIKRKDKLVALQPVGPWGWAARMKREDLLISTAVLAGCTFEPFLVYQYYVNMDGTIGEYPKWRRAELWLRDRGIEFTGLE